MTCEQQTTLITNSYVPNTIVAKEFVSRPYWSNEELGVNSSEKCSGLRSPQARNPEIPFFRGILIASRCHCKSMLSSLYLCNPIVWKSAKRLRKRYWWWKTFPSNQKRMHQTSICFESHNSQRMQQEMSVWYNYTAPPRGWSTQLRHRLVSTVCGTAFGSAFSVTVA